jgi:hypothetical protein
MKWLNIFQKILFSFISLFSFLLAVEFSYESESVLPGIWLTFSLFTFLIAWPETAESITFLGNSIKLRKLKSSLEDMRHLIEANTRAIFELVQTQMRFGGVSDAQKDEIFKALTEVLEKAGFSKKEIISIQDRWHYWIKGDYVRSILHVHNICHPEIKGEKQEAWDKDRIEIKNKIDEVTPEELRELFKKYNAYTVSVKDLIDDFEYYIANRAHRRPDMWKNREHWFKDNQ